MEKARMARLFKTICCVMLLAVLFAAGCNTMQGAGKDIKNAGQGIENAAGGGK
jgi:entericidin B